jgi:ADP-heptose:LPS heptosyltransferase
MEVRHALQRNSTAFWWPAEYRRKLCAGSYLETAHDIVGVAHEFGPLFFPTEDEKLAAAKARENAKVSDRCVAWVISGSRVDKLYPYTPHAIARIIKELDVSVMVIGTGSAQMEHARRIETEVKRTNSDRDKFHILVPHENLDRSVRWSVRPSLALAMSCDLVVTPDTGVGWAVAMEDMPKVLLCSHASEENIAKHWVNTAVLHADQNRVPCWPCHRLHDDSSTCVAAKDGGTAAACMADISVETILQTVERMLTRKSNVVRLEAAE